MRRFMRWGERVTDALRARGHWADYVDPCSGVPVLDGSRSSVYAEVDAMELLLRYKTDASTGCRMVLHPEWGASVCVVCAAAA